MTTSLDSSSICEEMPISGDGLELGREVRTGILVDPSHWTGSRAAGSYTTSCPLLKGPCEGLSVLQAVAMTRGCVRLEERVLSSYFLKGTLWFSDGLKGDVGHLGLTWA